MVTSLRKVFFIVEKIVAQVIETEFVVGTISNVCRISLLLAHWSQELMDNMERARLVTLPILFHMRLVIYKRFRVVKNTHGETQIKINLSHPDGVTAREVVIDRHHVNSFTHKSDKVSR